MSVLPLPDKWVRKAIWDALSPLTVDATSISIYDYSTGEDKPESYVLIGLQQSFHRDGTKCGMVWLHSTLIDVIVRRGKDDAVGRLFADNIANAVMQGIDGIALDGAAGMTINAQRISMERDFMDMRDNDEVYRKVIRVELEIN